MSILILLILIEKFKQSRQSRKNDLARTYLLQKYFDGLDVKNPVSTRYFVDAFIDIETQIVLEPDIRIQIINDFKQSRFISNMRKNLKSFYSYKRKEAIHYLSLFKDETTILRLKKQFNKEKDASVRFYLLHALKGQIDATFFNDILNSLEKFSLHYQQWVYAFLKNNYKEMSQYLMAYHLDPRDSVKHLWLYVAAYHLSADLKTYTIHAFLDNDESDDINYMALSVIEKQYPDFLLDSTYLNHENDLIKHAAIRCYASRIDEKTLLTLLDDLDGSKFDSTRIHTLSRIVYENKAFLNILVEEYDKRFRVFQKQAVARVLSHYIDYLALKITSDQRNIILSILNDLVVLGITEDLIDFMNSNKDNFIENALLDVIRNHASEKRETLDDFSMYLNQSILTKLGMIQKALPKSIKEKQPVERKKVIFIITCMLVAVLALPMLFLIENFTLLINDGPLITLAVISFNRYLAYYFITINTVYVLLLVFSIRGTIKRMLLWKIKKYPLLFEKDLLPSISIISPAYNEEKSIVESVTSLLNLKYPNYEVIVVSDGSKDKTVSKLIEHFELERKHPFFKMKINTKPIRSVYVSKKIPNLILVDKQNGGKADALNVGINVAKNDYICGIDADSLLEEDALLKLMSVTLDSDKTHIALGGNIVPVNGATIDRGKVEKGGLSKNLMVSFQTLEYLRAFTTGRVGFSELNSLLIVSGAFGLFNRLSLIDTGGYLTISSSLKKDTVGEDMELVVRLTHDAIIKKKRYKVSFVHNANCYTELPERFSSLLKQRNRWQRGLLDILSYHRKMIFNPMYKQPGLIGFSYYFIFEMMGPFVELFGYIALFTGLWMGILDSALVMLLFFASIGYGILVSLLSLYISERQNKYYPVKDMFKLILLAIIENFGYRQVMSVHRVFSSFSALNESGQWGSQQRTGFQTKQ